MNTLYIVDTNDNTIPEINLALEEFLVRHVDIANDYLFFYRNEPSLIIGKHQNPFREIDIPAMVTTDTPVFRRISGGGTVYHDLGNINFTFITKYTPQQFNKYFKFIKPIVEMLVCRGVPAEINARNDIVVGGRKISGNAQFSSRNALLSHGTLLYETDLVRLRKLLGHSVRGIESHSTKSVPSPVTNIASYLKDNISISEFLVCLRRVFENRYSETRDFILSEEDWKQVKRLAAERYMTWEWNYGRTPFFRVRRHVCFRESEINLEFEIDHGYLVSVKTDRSESDLSGIIREWGRVPFMPQLWKERLSDSGHFESDQIDELIMQIF